MNWIEIDLANEDAIVPVKGEKVLVYWGIFVVAEYKGFIDSCKAHLFIEDWECYEALRHVTHWCKLESPQ